MITRTGESPSPTLRYLCDDAKEVAPRSLRANAPSVHRDYRAAAAPPSADLTPDPLTPEGRCEQMIKWNYRATRVALVLGAIAAFAIASGAQTKWS